MLLPGKTLTPNRRPSRMRGVRRKTTIRSGFPEGPLMRGQQSEDCTCRLTCAYSMGVLMNSLLCNNNDPSDIGIVIPRHSGSMKDSWVGDPLLLHYMSVRGAHMLCPFLWFYLHICAFNLDIALKHLTCCRQFSLLLRRTLLVLRRRAWRQRCI
jgi:hypothetical protein